MTLTGETIEGYAVYSYTAKQGGQANLLFQESENVNKTSDLTWQAGKYYAPLKNEWYDTKEAAAEALAAPIEYEYVYLINTNDWAKALIYTWTPEVASYPGAAMTLEAEQIAGKDVYSYTAAPGAYKNVIFNNGSTQTADLVWTAGKYYVVDKWCTKDEAIAKLGAPIADTWTVVGGSGLLGSNWSLTDKANDMTLQADGTYKLVKENLSLAAGSYEYKAAKNRGWDVAVPQNGNQTLTISKAGKYTVTFVLDKNATKLTATATIQEEVEVIPTVAIAGEMNEWSETANLLTLAADKLTATATINLAEAKDYGFKVILGGNWLSDGGAVTREAATLVFTGANTQANTTLTADVAGEYTFTWTYATNTLVVTYPAKSTVGFENIEATENAVKFIENGKLYIIREGNVYDATGARVK